MDLHLLEGFDIEELSPQMIRSTEKFLVSGIRKTNSSTFNEYRWEQYGYKATDIGITPVILQVPCRPDDLPPP